jgi:hypothetical protein
MEVDRLSEALQKIVAAAGRNLRLYLDTLYQALGEFILHDYGHLVADPENGGIRLRHAQDERRLQRRRVALVRRYALSKEEQSLLDGIEEDLRADVYRLTLPRQARSVSSFSHVQLNLWNTRSEQPLLRTEWITLARDVVMGERSGAHSLASAVWKQWISSAPDPRYGEALLDYMRAYAEAWEYDPTWTQRLPPTPFERLWASLNTAA